MRKKKQMRSKASVSQVADPIDDISIGEMKTIYSMPLAADAAADALIAWAVDEKPTMVETIKKNINTFTLGQLKKCNTPRSAKWFKDNGLRIRSKYESVHATGKPAAPVVVAETTGEVISDEKPKKEEEPKTYFAGYRPGGPAAEKKSGNFTVAGVGFQETGEYLIDGGYTGDISGISLSDRRVKIKVPTIKERTRYSCVNNKKEYGPFMTESQALEVAKSKLGDSKIYKHVQQFDPITKEVYGSKDVLVRVYGTVYKDPVRHLGGEKIISDIDLTGAKLVSETAASANRKSNKKKV